MRKIFVLFLIACYFNTCKNEQKAKPALQKIILSKDPALIDYVKCKDSIAQLRKSLKSNWGKMPLAEKERIFVKSVTQTIIPPWLGTGWDFNGITEEPGKGKIACGYFVTTVLRDAGVKLNRVKLAQCASSEMIRSLVAVKNIHSFYYRSFEAFYEFIASNGFGLYIIGLDNHTGFIYHNGKDIYFIHSNFAGPKSVQQEKVSDSWILKGSGCHIVGKISTDARLLNSWCGNN
ncbi:MAG: hypothetical protein WAT19_15280 [Ferruginibacter sp.]